jgi:hypothetical protein
MTAGRSGVRSGYRHRGFEGCGSRRVQPGGHRVSMYRRGAALPNTGGTDEKRRLRPAGALRPRRPRHSFSECGELELKERAADRGAPETAAQASARGADTHRTATVRATERQLMVDGVMATGLSILPPCSFLSSAGEKPKPGSRSMGPYTPPNKPKSPSGRARQRPCSGGPAPAPEGSEPDWY